MDFIRSMLVKQERKNEEKAKLAKALDHYHGDMDGKSLAMIRQYANKRKKVVQDMKAAGMSFSATSVSSLREANATLEDRLLEVELQHAEAEEQVLTEFEKSYGEIIASINDLIASL